MSGEKEPLTGAIVERDTFCYHYGGGLGETAVGTADQQITGNDTVTARFLDGEYFNFVPTFKIFILKHYNMEFGDGKAKFTRKD
ncbi:MAG: hypothetical protein LBB48_07425 [Treponema sp.]|nr:hypothetical protein [Treponema sp.]